MTTLRPITLLLLSLLLTACATATGPLFTHSKFEHKGDKAIVYLYRPAQFVGAALTPAIYVDDHAISDLRQGGYAELRLAPGRHKIETRKGTVWSAMWNSPAPSSFEIEVEAQQVYYLRWVPVMEKMKVVPNSGTAVPNATFLGEFKLMNEADARDEINEIDVRRVYP